MCIGVRAGTGLLQPREGAVTSLGLRLREGHAGVCLTVEGGCFQSSCVQSSADFRGSLGGDWDSGSSSTEPWRVLFIAATTEAGKVCSSCHLCKLESWSLALPPSPALAFFRFSL